MATTNNHFYYRLISPLNFLDKLMIVLTIKCLKKVINVPHNFLLDKRYLL